MKASWGYTIQYIWKKFNMYTEFLSCIGFFNNSFVIIVIMFTIAVDYLNNPMHLGTY